MARRSGQTPLTRERILATALRLADASGLDALSMRRLATELGVDPMAIYHYLPSKDALLTGLVERVFAELRLPANPGGDWRARVRDWARAYHDLTLAHPRFVLHLVADPQRAAPAALAANEPLYAALEQAGFAPRPLLLAADSLVDYVNGCVLAVAAGALRDAGERQDLLALLARHPADAYPTLRRVFGQLCDAELHGDFDFGLDALLAGLASLPNVEVDALPDLS